MTFSLSFHAGDLSQPRVGPEIGAVEQDDLIAGVKHNVSRTGRHLRIVPRQGGPQRADLLKAAVGGGLQCNRSLCGKLPQRGHGLVVLPRHIYALAVDRHLQHCRFLRSFIESLQYRRQHRAGGVGGRVEAIAAHAVHQL